MEWKVNENKPKIKNKIKIKTKQINPISIPKKLKFTKTLPNLLPSHVFILKKL